MRALLACLVLAALLAGCGKTTEVREPDLVISGSSATPARPASSSPSRQRRPRIAVVTHGQASSAFWVIVRNGINAAARETNAIVTYSSPDVYSVDRMRRLVNDAVDRHPDGLVVSIPSPVLGGAIRRAVNMGIPVVSINSGSGMFRALGVLAHVGQPEDRAGAAAGRRMLRAGVRRAVCINHEVGNDGTDTRCRAFGRVLAHAGGVSHEVGVELQDPVAMRRGIQAEIAAMHADGVLTLNSDVASEVLPMLRNRPGIHLASFDLAPDLIEAVRRGRIDFLVDQQPYLQGFLPIVLLDEEIRHGLFPDRGEVVATGPHFVTRANARQVLALTRQGIR